jgi:hypothetical protein
VQFRPGGSARSIPRCGSFSILVVFPPDQFQPSKLKERHDAVVVRVFGGSIDPREHVRADADAQTPRWAVYENVLNRKLNSVPDETFHECATLGDAAMGDVPMSAFRHRPVFARPRVIAGERQFDIFRGEVQEGVSESRDGVTGRVCDLVFGQVEALREGSKEAPRVMEADYTMVHGNFTEFLSTLRSLQLAPGKACDPADVARHRLALSSSRTAGG